MCLASLTLPLCPVLQPAIDYLAGVAALEFNREFPLVVNTFQCYLKDTLPRLQLAIQAARSANVSFAAKLVRGQRS